MTSAKDPMNRIGDNLAYFCSAARIRAKRGRFDLHKDAERVFGTILSKVLGYELEDLNRKQYNHPAVDFGNQRVQIAIQITTTVSNKKIQHTLDTFLKQGLDKWYNHLMVMVITEDAGKLSAPTPPSHICFTKADIWDIPRLISEIESLEGDQKDWIDRYLHRQMGILQSEDTKQPERKKHRLIETRYLDLYINDKPGKLPKMSLYLPNRFRVESQYQVFDDITKPISAFLSGTLKAWMAENKIVLHEQAGQAEEKTVRDPVDITTLVVQGEQCTGKSTLVAQIIHGIDTGLLPFRNAYLLSFSERDLRTKSMSCRSICDYLRIQEEELDDNALLMIDAIDESGWFQQKANNVIAELINEIRVLNCKIIITSRSGYLDIKNEHLLELQLCRFSEEQALVWIQKYQQACPESDTKNLEQYVHNLIDLAYRKERVEKELIDRSRGLRVDERFPAKPLTKDEINLLHTAEVILMPHMMELCIKHKVGITGIGSMAQLYAQIFLPKINSNLLYNQYSISPNNAESINESKLHDAATRIAIQCLYKPEEGISYGTLEECIDDPGLMPVVCTKYLLTKIEEKYMFVHQSIPAFLVAWYFYERFSTPDDQSADASVMDWLWEIVGGNDVLTESVQEYIRYFARQDHNKIAERIIELLCKLLGFELCGTVAAGTALREAENQRKILCDNLVRLYAAFINRDDEQINEVDFFGKIKEPEQRKQLFLLLSDPETRASKSMGFCRLAERELDGVNLSGADLHRRYIHKMQMRGARLCETNLADAYVVECDLSLACMDRASSKGVQYHNSVLCGCSFRNANLNGAIFTDCNLGNADIRGARVFKTKFENCILWGMKVDISQLKELLYMDHNYIWMNRIQVYLGNNLLTAERFLVEYRRIRPIRSISAPNNWG